MNEARESSRHSWRFAFSLAAGLLLLASFAAKAQAAEYLDLTAVSPVISCEQLAKADLNQVAGAAVTIKSSTVADTPKGKFCKVKGNVDPAIGFEVDLPLEHWTQRYAQGGCGAYCGDIHLGLNHTGSCMPALNGEFAVASDNLGHEGGMGNPAGEAAFGADPQKKIDFAYRANHETALVAKALIKSFYGQPQKFAYFVGCSDGGREALQEAERFPDDFDGISAGAPVAIINVHNSFFHAWETAVNKRVDGTTILLRGRLSILHDAVVAHCPTLSGVEDGLLEDPRACKFDPAWVQCKAGAADTSKCLTVEEVGVVQKLYNGPADASGRRFEISGFPVGSEDTWNMPSSATGAQGGPGGGGGMAGGSLKYLLLPTVSEETPAALSAKFNYTEEWFNKVAELAPLYNAANTNLGPFEKHGGKLLLWHGLADTSVPPAISVAYYQGVQKELGEKLTDTFLRLFLLPGVGHCGMGDGPSQLDVLTPLMTWVEMKQAPKMLLTGKTASNGMMGPGGPGAPGQGGPNAAGGPGGSDAGPGGPTGPGQGAPGQGSPNAAGGPGGPGGPGGGGPAQNPYSSPDQPTLYTRPVFPYPYVAHYTGKGDKKDAANYEPVKSPVTLPQVFNTEATKLIGPNNQKFYHVENGQLVAEETK
jgi:feruloyl esterase